MVSCVDRIQQRHLRNGKLTDEEWPRLTEAIEKLRPAPLAIDDDPGLNLSELRDKVLRLKQESGTFGLVVVDGPQMMSGRWDYNLHGLKMLARELGCPLVLTAPPGNRVDDHRDKRPTLRDIRDGSGMESVPDIIMFLYRDEFYTEGACKQVGVVEVNIARQRTGPTGVVKLAFSETTSKFVRLDGSEWLD